MHGAFNEIYVIDCSTLRLIEINQAARDNLQFTTTAFTSMTLADLAHQPVAALVQTLHPLHNNNNNRLVQHITLELRFNRRDGSSYPIALRIFLTPYTSDTAEPVLIAIGHDISAQRLSKQALDQSESRYRAIAANTPGLVYQFRLLADGSTAFPYLSAGCHALLGIKANRLRAQPGLFLNLILQQDRAAYLSAMKTSAASMHSWNWEGRIWVEAWKDVKWINLRSTPGLTLQNEVQWDGIMTNITQSKLEELELKHSRARLAELTAHVEQVKEQERTRIAREIHDDLGGNLTAMKMALALLTRKLPPEETKLIEKAQYLDALVDRTIDAAHRIARDLRPGILDIGIVAAIEWQAREFEKQNGIPCTLCCDQDDIEIHPDHAAALFRIFQEGLTNIAKHARASHVVVRLNRTGQGIRLEITDNGQGITAMDRLKPESYGIRGMIERAKTLGGELSIGAAPDGGCSITIDLPIGDIRQRNHQKESTTI
ncbi:MAG: two-component sensor histidine kinase [Glaciimonas sp.]|nr:two-component sensor histidine kinase [Glaciimonas sp.]